MGRGLILLPLSPVTLFMPYCYSWSLCGSKVHELVQRTFSKEVTCSVSGRLCTLESVGRHSFSSLLETSARLGTGSSQGLSSYFITVCVCVCVCLCTCVYVFHIHTYAHTCEIHTHMCTCERVCGDRRISSDIVSSPGAVFLSFLLFLSPPFFFFLLLLPPTLRASLTGLKFTNQATSWPVDFSGPPVSASLELT